MKLSRSFMFISFFYSVGFSDAYLFNYTSCGIELLKCDTTFGQRTDTTIKRTLVDKQMICKPDTCYWDETWHTDTTTTTTTYPVVKCSWKECFTYSLFDSKNTSYEIHCRVSLVGGSCHRSYSIDSVWGDRDIKPSINNTIFFTFTADTVQCAMIRSLLFATNKTTGDTLATVYNVEYSIDKVLPTEVSQPQVLRPAIASRAEALNSIFTNWSAKSSVYTLNGKKVLVSDREKFNALPKGIYLLRTNPGRFIRLLKR